jgi:hypothetical protein
MLNKFSEIQCNVQETCIDIIQQLSGEMNMTNRTIENSLIKQIKDLKTILERDQQLRITVKSVINSLNTTLQQKICQLQLGSIAGVSNNFQVINGSRTSDMNGYHENTKTLLTAYNHEISRENTLNNTLTINEIRWMRDKVNEFIQLKDSIRYMSNIMIKNHTVELKILEEMEINKEIQTNLIMEKLEIINSKKKQIQSQLNADDNNFILLHEKIALIEKLLIVSHTKSNRAQSIVDKLIKNNTITQNENQNLIKLTTKRMKKLINHIT